MINWGGVVETRRPEGCKLKGPKAMKDDFGRVSILKKICEVSRIGCGIL